ncbi:hypothetical protein ACIRPH_01850 [Nocardiopsis sp. NPDC101807]|uniref:hypothetical protein n=1 Tax=Nocardiopsis sp. NPDC101807 TaxID=3364339 RepID=UPI00380E4AED
MVWSNGIRGSSFWHRGRGRVRQAAQVVEAPGEGLRATAVDEHPGASGGAGGDGPLDHGPYVRVAQRVLADPVPVAVVDLDALEQRAEAREVLADELSAGRGDEQPGQDAAHGRAADGLEDRDPLQGGAEGDLGRRDGPGGPGDGPGRLDQDRRHHVVDVCRLAQLGRERAARSRHVAGAVPLPAGEGREGAVVVVGGRSAEVPPDAVVRRVPGIGELVQLLAEGVVDLRSGAHGRCAGPGQVDPRCR